MKKKSTRDKVNFIQTRSFCAVASLLTALVAGCFQSLPTFAQDWNSEESSARENSSGRKSDGGMKKVAGVPLPNGRDSRDVPPVASTRSLPGRKSLPYEPSTVFPARSLFLNGVNIGSVRDQELENVTVKIDAEGNIHLFAPHYDVREDTSYHPLMPQELPRFPKAGPVPEGLPQGPYSKQTGEKVGSARTDDERGGQQNNENSRPEKMRKAENEPRNTGSKDPSESKESAPAGFIPVGKGQPDKK